MFGKQSLLSISYILIFVLSASAQEYVLEPRDRITIHFWQEPSLDVEMVIDSDGKIVVPVAGRITAAGLTVSQLEGKIIQQINIYNRNVTQALVKVIEYGSKKIFVTGAVLMPGPLTFARMPNVWEAILQAGGALETARLDNIMILRGGENHGQRIPVNLTNYFADLTKLPELRPNDNIYVPSTGTNGPGGTDAAGRAGAGLYTKKKVVYIYGEVVSPGRYELEENMDVLQAVIIAGGPSSGRGRTRAGANAPAIQPDLRSVRVISQSQKGPVVYELNLERYAEEGTPVPFQLKPGDTIFIPSRDAYGRFVLTNVLRTVLTSALSILVSLVILNNAR
jgi:polysaccharide export outer membrane protein